MNKNSTLTRVQDNKVFHVVEMGHWTDIIAEDGERDRVKFLQGDRFSEEYVSQEKGMSYMTTGVVEPPKSVILDEMQVFSDTMDANGISTLVVKDGRFFGFTKQKLQQLIDAIPPGQDKLIIFIQASKGTNGN